VSADNETFLRAREPLRRDSGCNGNGFIALLN